MEKLIILDYAIGTVDIYNIAEGVTVDEEYITTKLGYQLNYCEWMVGEGNITFHKEVLK